VTDKGRQDLEIKRREFEKRTAAFLEQLGETDTQEMVRLLRRANEIIDRNQERRDAE
jgi:DNA-binding MarR family transcriptional regulator